MNLTMVSLSSFFPLGSESEYSGEEDDDEDFEEEESGSSMFISMMKRPIISLYLYLDESDNLGSDEESGKSWSELEEEARKGKV